MAFNSHIALNLVLVLQKLRKRMYNSFLSLVHTSVTRQAYARTQMSWFVDDWFCACVCLAFVLVLMLISPKWTRLYRLTPIQLPYYIAHKQTGQIAGAYAGGVALGARAAPPPPPSPQPEKKVPLRNIQKRNKVPSDMLAKKNARSAKIRQN